MHIQNLFNLTILRQLGGYLQSGETVLDCAFKLNQI